MNRFAVFTRQHNEAQRLKDIAGHAAYIRDCGAEPWAVYRCDRIGRGQTPQNETPVAVRTSPSEAMDLANTLKAKDRDHSYVVGAY